MDFSVIKTTCILPESYSSMSYHDAMQQLNPSFSFIDFITPFYLTETLYAWVRITEDISTKINYYLVETESVDYTLNEFINAVGNLNPAVTVEKVNLTKEELLEKFSNHDSVHVKFFSKIKELFD